MSPTPPPRRCTRGSASSAGRSTRCTACRARVRAVTSADAPRCEAVNPADAFRNTFFFQTSDLSSLHVHLDQGDRTSLLLSVGLDGGSRLDEPRGPPNYP